MGLEEQIESVKKRFDYYSQRKDLKNASVCMEQLIELGVTDEVIFEGLYNYYKISYSELAVELRDGEGLDEYETKHMQNKSERLMHKSFEVLGKAKELQKLNKYLKNECEKLDNSFRKRIDLGFEGELNVTDINRFIIYSNLNGKTEFAKIKLSDLVDCGKLAKEDALASAEYCSKNGLNEVANYLFERLDLEMFDSDSIHNYIYSLVGEGHHEKASLLLYYSVNNDKYNVSLLKSLFDLSVKKINANDETLKNLQILEDVIKKTQEIASGEKKIEIRNGLAQCVKDELYFANYALNDYAEKFLEIEGFRNFLWLEGIGDLLHGGSKKHLKNLSDLMLKNGDFKKNLKTFQKSSSEVASFSHDKLEDSIVVKKRKTIDYKEEVKNTEIVGTIFGSEISVPLAVDEFKLGGEYFYIMKRAKGEELTKLVDLGDDVNPLIFDLILKNIAKVHFSYPTKGLEKYCFEEKINEKANGFSEEFKQAMIQITKPLQNSKYWTYNLDSATNNWLIGGSGIVKVDNEDRGSVPCAVDLAQFLNCVPFFDHGGRRGKVEVYCQAVQSSFGEIDWKSFANEYDAAVIYRAFANFNSNYASNRLKVLHTGIEMCWDVNDELAHAGKEVQGEPYRVVFNEFVEKRDSLIESD